MNPAVPLFAILIGLLILSQLLEKQRGPYITTAAALRAVQNSELRLVDDEKVVGHQGMPPPVLVKK